MTPTVHRYDTTGEVSGAWVLTKLLILSPASFPPSWLASPLLRKLRRPRGRVTMSEQCHSFIWQLESTSFASCCHEK